MEKPSLQWIKDVCPTTLFILAQIWRSYKKKISVTCWFSTRYADFGGERGIRTPGGVTLNGFQDRRIRPLCHLSEIKNCFVLTGAKVATYF